MPNRPERSRPRRVTSFPDTTRASTRASGSIAIELLLLLLFFLLPGCRAEQALDLAETAKVQPGTDKHDCKIKEDVSPHDACDTVLANVHVRIR
jgi:hypothetical protein